MGMASLSYQGKFVTFSIYYRWIIEGMTVDGKADGDVANRLIKLQDRLRFGDERGCEWEDSTKMSAEGKLVRWNWMPMSLIISTPTLR